MKSLILFATLALATLHPRDDPAPGLKPIPANVILDSPPDLTKPPSTAGAKVTKKRFGPFKVAAGQELNDFYPFKGPCRGDCYITAIWASLEYEDGTEANIDTGVWNHHFASFQGGRGQKEVICPFPNMPAVNSYGSGNERTPKRVNRSGKYGIFYSKRDTNNMLVGIMNEGQKEVEVYVTMTWEYVEGWAARGYKATKQLTLKEGTCYSQDIPTPVAGKLTVNAGPWNSTIAGKLLHGVGHVHDGATHVTMYINGKEACTSKMVYSHLPGYISSPEHGHGEHGDHRKRDGGAIDHISGAGICLDFAEIKVGDQITHTCEYDFDLYPPMIHNGEPHPLMCFMQVEVAPK